MAGHGRRLGVHLRHGLLVSQPAIELGARRLPRGAFLLLGGDEVYPAASKQEYGERLVGPLGAALTPPRAAARA
jgi:hypothetical protein